MMLEGNEHVGSGSYGNRKNKDGSAYEEKEYQFRPKGKLRVEAALMILLKRHQEIECLKVDVDNKKTL
jgi:hypothetical protein